MQRKLCFLTSGDTYPKSVKHYLQATACTPTNISLAKARTTQYSGIFTIGSLMCPVLRKLRFGGHRKRFYSEYHQNEICIKLEKTYRTV